MAEYSLVLEGGLASAVTCLLKDGETVAQGEETGSCNPTTQSKDKALMTLAGSLARVFDQHHPETPLRTVYAGVEGCFSGARRQWLETVVVAHLSGFVGRQTRVIATDTLYAAFRAASDKPSGILIAINGGICITAFEKGEKKPGSKEGVHDITPLFLRGPILGQKICELMERRDPLRLEATLAACPEAATRTSLVTPLVFAPVVWNVLGPEVLANVHLGIEIGMDKAVSGDIVLHGPDPERTPLWTDLQRAYPGQVQSSAGRPLEGMIRLASLGRVF